MMSLTANQRRSLLALVSEARRDIPIRSGTKHRRLTSWVRQR